MKNRATGIGIELEMLFGMVASRVFQHASTMLSGEVTFARVMSLFHLHHHETGSIAEIAEAAGLSHAAASRMVDGLYREGLVDRQEDPEDRRHKRIELTPDALKRIEAMRGVTAEAYAALMGDVPKDLQVRFLDILKELEPHLTKPADEPVYPRNKVQATR